MSLRDHLRGWDDRLLPRAADCLGASVAQFEARRDRWRRRQLGTPGSEGLRGLDGRYARSGPLAPFRNVPQLGFVVIGLVLLAAAGTAVSLVAATNRHAQQQTVVDPGRTGGAIRPGSDDRAGDNTLGPAVGDMVSTYLAKVAKSLAVAENSSPEGTRVALVSFSTYQDPAQLRSMMSASHVLRIYLRAKVGGKGAAQLPFAVTGDLGATLSEAYAKAARGRADQRSSYRGYVDTLQVVTAADQALRDTYAAFASAAGAEAEAYQSGCACVFAAVVSAAPSTLPALRARIGVRAIQVAPEGAQLTALRVSPLQPDVTGLVQKQQAAVDSS